MFLNAGLTYDHVETVNAALKLVDRPDLAQLYVTCNELQTVLLNLLLEEMFSTRSDMVYWERFRKGSHWEISLSRLNSRIFNVVFPREDNVETLFQDPTNLIHYIESLKADFYGLAVFLAKLNHAGARLKKLYNDINKRSIFQHPVRNALVIAKTRSGKAQVALAEDAEDAIDNAWATVTSERIVDDVVGQTEALLRDFFVDITQAIAEHMPRLALLEVAPFCGREELQQATMAEVQEAVSFVTDSLLRHPCFDTGFPLGITHLKVRRPSYMERYWIRNILVSIAGIYFANTTIRMIQTGELQRQTAKLLVFVQNKLQEHVVEPVSDLAMELFDTIRKREKIVSREDLDASRDALHRMLVEFSQSKEGSTLILNRLNVDHLKDELLKRSDTLFETIKNGGGGGTATAASVVPANPAAGALPSSGAAAGIGGASSSGTEMASFTPEQAWDALMSEYEKELQTPIRGIIYGNLFTAMLIQMQKLKVHTEAAMLTMDQILASNELTIAATAAMPALIAFGLGISWLRSLLQPKAQTPGAHTLHFRLILCDVERSLLAWQARVDELNALQSPPASEPSEDPARTDAARAVDQAKGLFTFHMARLRSKFHEMFDIRSPNTEVRSSSRGSGGGGAMQHRGRRPKRHQPLSAAASSPLKAAGGGSGKHAMVAAARQGSGRTQPRGGSSGRHLRRPSASDKRIAAAKLSTDVRRQLVADFSDRGEEGAVLPAPSPATPSLYVVLNPLQWPWIASALSARWWSWVRDLGLGRARLAQSATLPSGESPLAPSAPSAGDDDRAKSTVASPDDGGWVALLNRPVAALARHVWHAHRAVWHVVQSSEDFVVSAHWLLWGNNAEYQSNTNVYNSLEADLLLLESDVREVSIAQKLDVLQSMRMSYKCLSPVN